MKKLHEVVHPKNVTIQHFPIKVKDKDGTVWVLTSADWSGYWAHREDKKPVREGSRHLGCILNYSMTGFELVT